MNPSWHFNISEFLLVEFLLLGVILFISFRLLQTVLHRADLKKPYRLRLGQGFLVVEMLVWLIFSFQMLKSLFRESPQLAYLLLGVMVAVGIGSVWFAIRDIAAGIILKSEDVYQVGDWLEWDTYQGYIRTLGFRILEIETHDGERVKIPYSTISQGVIKKTSPIETEKTYVFQLQVPASQVNPEFLSWLREIILNFPAASLKREPRLKSVRQTADVVEFEVTVYSFHDRYFHEMERQIKDQLSQFFSHPSVTEKIH
ncbi:MAG: hypothetical protein D6675_01135 [Gemmatimonadetes bacterium]|nr:MAG: hypothetical protein D6675_01135 [Gemmatimonadota bacterium]